VTGRAWVNAILAAGIGVAMLTWLHPAGTDYSAAGRGWNGLQRTAGALNAVTLATADEYSLLAPPGTLILVPSMLPERSALGSISAFVRGGGVLLLLDDYGYGNAVLEALGAPITFSGRPLVDPLHCDTNETMPRAKVSSDSTADAVALTMNHGSWLEVGDGVETWARSSYFSYGDADNNGKWDSGEPEGPLPVGVNWVWGEGQVVVAADASLLINAMVERSDNLEVLSRFVRAPVYIDQVYHAADTSVDLNKQRMERVRSLVSHPAAVAAAIMLLAGAALWYGWYARKA